MIINKIKIKEIMEAYHPDMNTLIRSSKGTYYNDSDDFTPRMSSVAESLNSIKELKNHGINDYTLPDETFDNSNTQTIREEPSVESREEPSEVIEEIPTRELPQHSGYNQYGKYINNKNSTYNNYM